MNLNSYIDLLQAGGPGSGCQGDNCGRPKGAATARFEVARGAIGKIYQALNDGQWHKESELEPLAGNAKLSYRLYILSKVGKEKGSWTIEKNDGRVRLVRMNKPAAQTLNREASTTTPKEQYLSSAPVSQQKLLGKGGINDAQLVTFDDGSKGVFKTSGMYSDIKAEVAAYQVAKIVGVDDMVPPTVLRTIAGKKGSLQEFKDNATVAGNSADPYDGTDNAARAYVFDTVIGNSDRHMGNWLIDNATGKPVLIDHGISFPVRGSTTLRPRLRPQGSLDSWPPFQTVLKPYREHVGEIVQVMKNLGMPTRSIDGVEARIALLSDAAGWDSPAVGLPRRGFR